MPADGLLKTLEQEVAIAELAIAAYTQCPEFLEYLKGEKLADISYRTKDVILKDFLYPLLQRTTDETKRQCLLMEIERIERHTGGI